MKVKIKQFRNKAKEPVAGLTPEHAIYDANGVRLDAKLGNVNLQEFRDLQQQSVNAIKEQQQVSENYINTIAENTKNIIDQKYEETAALTQAAMVGCNTEGLEGNNVQENLNYASNKLLILDEIINGYSKTFIFGENNSYTKKPIKLKAGSYTITCSNLTDWLKLYNNSEALYSFPPDSSIIKLNISENIANSLNYIHTLSSIENPPIIEIKNNKDGILYNLSEKVDKPIPEMQTTMHDIQPNVVLQCTSTSYETHKCVLQEGILYKLDITINDESQYDNTINFLYESKIVDRLVIPNKNNLTFYYTPKTKIDSISILHLTITISAINIQKQFVNINNEIEHIKSTIGLSNYSNIYQQNDRFIIPNGHYHIKLKNVLNTQNNITIQSYNNNKEINIFLYKEIPANSEIVEFNVVIKDILFFIVNNTIQIKLYNADVENEIEEISGIENTYYNLERPFKKGEHYVITNLSNTEEVFKIINTSGEYEILGRMKPNVPKFWTPDKNYTAIHSSSSIKITYFPNNNNKIFYCGPTRTYKTLKSAIEAASLGVYNTLYVDAGTYDLIEEFGEAYFESLNENNTLAGLQLANRIHIIFDANSKVVCNYTGNNDYVKSLFSPFNTSNYGFILENLTLECSNVRYAIHDERNGSIEPCISKYINCHIKVDNSNNTAWHGNTSIGGGCGSNHIIEVFGCIFEAITLTNSIVGWHLSNDANNNNHKVKIIVNNNYFINGNLNFSSGRTESIEKSTIIVSGNSFNYIAGANDQGILNQINTNDVKLLAWNNEVRK